MSLQSVRDFFAARQLDIPIIELEVSTATVALAAEAHGVEPGRIAKTLSFRLNAGQVIILVAAGDARIDNRKFKESFGKGKMLHLDEVVELTGHPVGGVCPFGESVADLSGQVVAEFRRGPAGCRCHPQRGAHQPDATGRSDRRPVGGCLSVMMSISFQNRRSCVG